MKVKTLAAMLVSGILAASLANADPATNDGSGMSDNFGSMQGPQLADNGANSGMSGAPAMSGSGGSSDSSNMSGTPSNNMSGTPNNNMGDSSSPSDEGGADTATGDDY
jgi:hypothetical protein